MFGLELKNTPFDTVDVIIPVPLHPSKLKKRGYNQSELIAKGISESLQIPLETKTVQRISATSTQTRKSRYERWENVNHTFMVTGGQLLKNKHILLVDDVITTGATLEACADALLISEDLTISIASLACVKLQ
jgi:ComF family protein